MPTTSTTIPDNPLSSPGIAAVHFCFLMLLAACFAAPAYAGQVVLDVGHSIKAPGATSASGVSEFYHNQALAYDVSGMLTMLQVSHSLVGYEGKADVLTDRTKQAAGAALFVSLHHDSIQPQFMARATEFSGYSLLGLTRNSGFESFACMGNMRPTGGLPCLVNVI
jgi:N-acetylmuramoyl-L-alanine amidase